MGQVAAETKLWTVDDVHALPDDGNRYEVIDGELLVTPAPSLMHQDIVLRLARILADYLDRECVGHLVIAPADVQFSTRRLVQPDVFVAALVNGRRPMSYDEIGKLLLAVEVVSPSTSRADRVSKRQIYREEGVAEYWVVDGDARVFERSTPGDGRIDVASDELIWHPAGAAEALTFSVASFFAALGGERGGEEE